MMHKGFITGAPVYNTFNLKSERSNLARIRKIV